MIRRFMGAALGLALLGGAGAAQADDPVKIGYAIAKTGPFAEAAHSQLQTYELWTDQVNARGGIDVAGQKRPVKFIVYDDQSDFSKEPAIYEKLITGDKVDLLLSPWGTPFHFAVAAVLEKYQFPMVGSTAASVQLRDLKPGNIWFPTSAIPDRMSVELIKMMKQEGVKTVAVNSLQLDFTQEVRKFLIPEIEKSGIKILVNKEYPPDVKDMTVALTEIKQAAPDAVLSLSYPSDSVLYLKQAREIGINAPFQLVLVGPTAAFFGQMFGANLDGIVTMGHWTQNNPKWPRAKVFYDAFVAKFHEKPDYLDSALPYMANEILEQAVAKVGLDKAKLREEISTHTFDTINGPVRFEGVQNVLTPTMFLQFQKGGAQIVWPQSEATAPFMPKPAWTK